MTSSAKPARDEWLIATLEGLLDASQVSALREKPPESLWEDVVRRGWVTEEALVQAVAARFRMRVADVGSVSQSAREQVPETLARRYRILPLSISDSVLDIATANPLDLDCERTLAFALGRTVRMSIAAPRKISERLDEVYRPENLFEKLLERVEGTYDVETVDESAEDDDINLSAARAGERPVIQLVDRIVAEGIQSRASDIHLEPEEGGIVVRYRIDGVLREAMKLPKAAGIPLVSRVKIMASLDIADRLRPQDGRARVAVSGNRVDLRVSTLPASQGEKVVIRVLDQRSTILSLDSLGLLPDELNRIHELLQAREGIVLVTGPTGSGKTTTLYSMLRSVQGRGVNIVTVEDPVEYRLQGIVQVQVNEKAGLTFPAALRSILRQDPDVILVGEIRDKETANIAVQASLTGHLVLSTLHTNDAASSVTRLVDIGIESYKIAAALKGVVAQRLMRRLCLQCRELAVGQVPDRLQRYFPEQGTLYRAVGCPECAQTGYRGRLAIEEVLQVTEEVERRIAGNESVDRINDAAKDGGMRSLWDSAVQHVRQGETTIEELLRVLEAPGESGTRSGASPRVTTQEVEVRKPTSSTPPRPSAMTAPVLDDEDSPSAPAPGTPKRRAGTRHSAPATFTGDSFELVGEEHEKKPAAKRVLLVEDEDSLRRVMKDLLEREGFVVHEAADGVIALDEVDRLAPDLVVLDLNLPRLDGYGVLSHLRARPATQKLPVIVLTAKGDEDSEVRVFEYGASDYLTKPFRARALSARIHSLIGRKASS
ncbi:MAG: Flp pilus assembly complex ATPase component TadA [Gemmatimonadaceae bacterium]|nr:Flp pilus assembly complex ATPase component TadA [Gemmatimonadaceae bacterium]